MAQFDAFAHPVPSLRRIYPLAVSLRSDLIPAGEDTVIAPLVPKTQIGAVSGRLAPVVRIDEEEYVVLVQMLTTVPSRGLPRRIANLNAWRMQLLGAVDLLFYGI